MSTNEIRFKLGSVKGVLPPCDFVAVYGSTQDIDVSVIVHISSVNGTGSLKTLSDRMPVEILIPVVLKPNDLIDETYCSQHVDVTIEIDIRCIDATWTPPIT